MESLLGILEMETRPDDFTVEGAINLINKVGLDYEKRNKNPTKPSDFKRKD